MAGTGGRGCAGGAWPAAAGAPWMSTRAVTHTSPGRPQATAVGAAHMQAPVHAHRQVLRGGAHAAAACRAAKADALPPIRFCCADFTHRACGTLPGQHAAAAVTARVRVWVWVWVWVGVTCGAAVAVALPRQAHSQAPQHLHPPLRPPPPPPLHTPPPPPPLLHDCAEADTAAV